jgi:S-formylglutathione hydrolase FrmB
LALLAMLLTLSSMPTTATAVTEGLTVVSQSALSDRLSEITVYSPAMERETTLRVLLPTGYDPAADVDLPVLYLLHGCCDTYRSWSDKTDLEAFTADMDVVVVMPDAGNGGWYTDWYRGGAGGTPRWESYYIGELIPWVEATYDVLPAREGRAVAGLSMGGFGAMKYAARHPDLFLAAAPSPTAVDTNVDAAGVITDAIAALDGARPGDVFGPKATDAIRWRRHNPWDLAENLSTVAVELRTANGITATGVDPILEFSRLAVAGPRGSRCPAAERAR